MRAWFTSLDGGRRLRQQIVSLLSSASEVPADRTVDVHVMTFSFTDAAIADTVAGLATQRANVRVRIIADWGQGASVDGRQVRRLADLGLDNLTVRYKRDQPYRWDAENVRLRWSYSASRGLLHHKTLGLFVDGHPLALAAGSFNWTGRAADSYENLVLLEAGEPGADRVMRAMELEFEALWSDGRLTLSPSEAVAHHQAILAQYRADPSLSPDAVVGSAPGRDDPLSILVPAPPQPAQPPADGSTDDKSTDDPPPLVIAFSSRAPHEAGGGRGYAGANAGRRFLLQKPGGSRARAPLGITTAALDLLAGCQPGDDLHVAMYGLSRRVPEYGALLAAARRGVRVRVLLDGQVGRSVLGHLARAALREELPLQVRAGRRTMHQKYLVHPASSTVLTGTANLSTDASGRHSEHVLVARGDDALVGRFVADFDTIWERLPVPPRDRTDR